MTRTLAKLPFTLAAVGSLAFFALAAALPPSAFQAAMLGTARVFIIPVYLVLLGFSVVMQLFGTPQTGVLRDFVASTAFALALIPFMALDLLLHRLRNRRVPGA